MKKKLYFNPHLKKIFLISPTEDIYIDDDFTTLTKFETKIDIGKPNLMEIIWQWSQNNDKNEIKKSKNNNWHQKQEKYNNNLRLLIRKYW